MTDPLTIKDLNCGNCSKFSRIKKSIFTKKQCHGCGMSLEQEIELPSCNGEPLDQFTPSITKNIGCCLHPLALQVLAAPAIAELGKIRQRNDIRGNCRNLNFHDGVAHGCESAITLLKGAP